MKTFLEELSEHILKHHSDHLEKLCIVLPNKRGGLYLKKFIAQQSGKTVWAPRILSIESMVSELSGLELSNHLTLMTELFKVHQTIKQEDAGDFTEFLNWGSIIIKDFNDTDHYLADARQLYNYLDASRAMTLWNPDGRPLTEFQHNYLQFYQSLHVYYEQFRAQLFQKKCAYSGMAFRKLAEAPEAVFEHDTRTYIFAGFNALTGAEEKIIRYLTQHKKAECIWDGDVYYTENTDQEAGSFLRKYRSDWKLKNLNISTNAFAEKSATLEVIGVAGNVGQAKVCGDILNKLTPQEIAETCVVLSDEKLLIPMLNAVPAGIEKFNVTMGFPLELSALHTLITGLFSMQESAQRFRGLRDSKDQMIFFKDLQQLLSHPYIIQWTTVQSEEGNYSASHKLTSYFLKQQQYFIPYPVLIEQSKAFGIEVQSRIAVLFSSWTETPGGPLAVLEGLMQQLLEFFTTRPEAQLEREYLYQYKCLVQSARALLEEYALQPDLRGSQAILRLFSQSSSIPFYGEPLSGFQVMGVLETRNLDFKNIIMLSVNDDIIPGGKMQQSYIPNDIRLDFGLPTYKDKEAVFAYHFYRLLQRSEHVRLLYNTQSGPMGGGEQSRFISQLLHELPTYNPNIEITQKIFSLPPLMNLPPTDIVIEKSAEVMKQLENKAIRGFSPSSINAYVNCSLKFYFRELLGLQEKESVEESLDAATLGKTIHDVLHRLYLPFVGKTVEEKDFESMTPQVDALCDEIFHKVLQGGDFRFGKNLLLYKVARTYITNYLRQESQESKDVLRLKNPLQILQLEEELSTTYAVGEIAKCAVKMKGFADRIDQVEDVVRIIDYKTGAVDEKELKLPDLSPFFSEEHSEKAFQLIFYAYLYYKMHPEGKDHITSGLLSFRYLSKGFLPLQLNGSLTISRADALAFEALLKQWVHSVFDTEIPFSQTTDADVCKNCDYAAICYK